MNYAYLKQTDLEQNSGWNYKINDLPRIKVRIWVKWGKTANTKLLKFVMIWRKTFGKQYYFKKVTWPNCKQRNFAKTTSYVKEGRQSNNRNI